MRDLPDFKKDDIVRIMQVPEMLAQGIASICGKVIFSGDTDCLIKCDDGVERNIPHHSLSKIPQTIYDNWKKNGVETDKGKKKMEKLILILVIIIWLCGCVRYTVRTRVMYSSDGMQIIETTEEWTGSNKEEIRKKVGLE